ncbi:lipid A biosynthesis acyltransferase [Labrenzia sp. R4_2]|uniref:lysophospholipid acyltransferase family protein n=2 Tax=Stappiaceae TaxID=2821832 RepID=UPI001ADB8CC5|nr:lipid A biosynthesis acyltransferase [Labrenzia sp. R4_2]
MTSSTSMTFRNHLESLLLSAAIGLFRLFPVDFASWLMGRCWRWIAPLNARHKRALTHLKNAYPDMPLKEREKIVLGMWDNLGRVAAETFHIDRLLHQDHRFEADADEITQAVLRGEQAALFVSFHSGNWEMCVQPAVMGGLEITGVYQALKNPEADKALRSLRKDLYKGGLLSKGHQTARKILSTLKAGGIVAIMGDLRETRGIQVPFFGQMAYANPIPASLARSCGVPIVLGRVIRKNGVNFRIEGRAISVPVTEDRQADIEAATVRIHEIFEEWIREHPEQWMWIHKKWAAAGSAAPAKDAA